MAQRLTTMPAPKTLDLMAKGSFVLGAACAATYVAVSQFWPRHWPSVVVAAGNVGLVGAIAISAFGFICGLAVWLLAKPPIGARTLLLAATGTVANGIFAAWAFVLWGMSNSAWH